MIPTLSKSLSINYGQYFMSTALVTVSNETSGNKGPEDNLHMLCFCLFQFDIQPVLDESPFKSPSVKQQDMVLCNSEYVR